MIRVIRPQGRHVTKTRNSGTNAEPAMTATQSRARRALRWFVMLPGWTPQFILCAVFVVVNAFVESASVATDLSRHGVAFIPAGPTIWAFSSAASILIWFVPLLMVDAAMRARVKSMTVRFAGYVVASIVFCALHVATMVALRHIVYAAFGWRYDFGPSLDGFIYEYRKDALTFALIVGLAAAWRYAVGRERRSAADPAHIATAANSIPTATATAHEPSASAVPRQAPTFMVRTTQGDLLIRADDIDWVEAQGNYVALHVQGNVRLLRHTLAEMESKLADHGFIRTHRRALVNRQRMLAIIPPELGELGVLGVRLSSGQVAPLSESRRPEVVRLVLGA
jgi:hypothetical protein